MPHRPTGLLLTLFAIVWGSAGSALADPLTLRQGGRYDHENEITVCLSSDAAKKFYRTFEGANAYTSGCFPAKLGDFSPLYRVDNIKMITETEALGFVYGTAGSVTPRSGDILHGVPVYIVTPAIVVDQNQKDVLVPDLE